MLLGELQDATRTGLLQSPHEVREHHKRFSKTVAPAPLSSYERSRSPRCGCLGIRSTGVGEDDNWHRTCGQCDGQLGRLTKGGALHGITLEATRGVVMNDVQRADPVICGEGGFPSAKIRYEPDLCISHGDTSVTVELVG